MHLYKNELDVYVERLNSELSKKYKKESIENIVCSMLVNYFIN